MDWILTGETPGRCSVGCDKKMSELCKKVKRILDSKTAFGNALEANIHAFDESVTLKREVENLKEVMSKGRLSGTSEKPARRAGQKRRAG